jgi:IPT/TIG domain
MTLFKRHIGRRVAGVGLAAALLVFLVEAPAFALTPTISSFTPTSGPAATGAGGCVVVISGTNFDNPTVSDVSFTSGTGTESTDFSIKSATTIWATVPALATIGPITVTNGSGTATSSTDFVVAAAGTPGGCAPTIASISPTCGPTGTEMTITGSHLLRGANPLLGGHVQFNPYDAFPDADQVSASPTEVHVSVPDSATGTQPIRLDTFDTTVGSGRVFSADQFVAGGTCVTNLSPASGPVGQLVTITGVGFQNVTKVTFTNNVQVGSFTETDTSAFDTIVTKVPVDAVTGPITLFTVDAPDGVSVQTADFTVTVPVTPVTHSRSVTLALRKHLVARGKVSVGDGFTACFANVPVKIQRKVSGVWKTVRTAFTTSTGSYGKRLPNRSGRYRSLAPKLTLNSGADICARAVSPTRRYIA